MHTTLSVALADVFDRGAEHRLDLAAEIAAIADAKAGGDAGLLALVYAYAPVLRSQVRRAGETLDTDEARQVAALALLEAVHACAPGARLAGFLGVRVFAELAEATSDASMPVHVPARTAERFWGILARADGDVERAAAIAPDYAMSRETFFDCLRALRTERLDEPTGEGAAPRADGAETLWGVVDDAADRVLVELAFRAVDELETDICRLAYGFADYDPCADAEIGERLGMGRATVQRRRAGALGKMRDALGA